MTQYCPIVATLGYVMSEDGGSVLLVHRNKRADDIHFGKYNGLGGKLERGEDVVSGFYREVREEAGIEPEKVILRGTINWPGFGKDGEDWLGFIFRVDQWSGDVILENHEGILEWVSLSDLSQINFWESDRYWLDMVFDADERAFHGIAPFDNGRMVSWYCVRI
ncbi:MAG: 8-oxo-dGTP diphosphatase [Candidatus Obscuribacterales bacterium]|nr:8-oxo-dGTP diphosphatase [Candidatus Obscuribacterales bacterium]